MGRDFFRGGPGSFGYSWVHAKDVPEGKNMDELFKEVYDRATKERKERGYIVDDLEKFNSPAYGVTEPEKK